MVTRGTFTVGLLASLAAAFMLAAAAIWATSAQSQSRSKAAPEIRVADLQILGVNDFHGNLEPSTRRDVPGRTLGGAAYLDAYLNQYEARNPERTIRVHAGDMVGGSPLISSHFHDEPTVYAMNEMEFDVGTLGNHEFDEGGEEMLRLLTGGQRDDGLQFKDGADGEPVNTSDPDFPGTAFPYVAANTTYKDSGKTVLPPYKVVTKDGVKVGFIGVTTLETPNIVVPDAVAPFAYADISDTVNRYVEELRRRRVESIVVLAHAGGQYQSPEVATGEIIDETGQMSDAVDVVIAGHSHSLLNNRVGNKLVVEAHSFGTAFDAVNMRIDRRTRDVVSSSAEVVNTYNDAITPDAATAELVARYKAEITPIAERVVGSTSATVSRAQNDSGESALGDLIADAQRDFAGADFAFMNPGGIRADIAGPSGGATEEPVTFGELFTVQPFDNQVVKFELTGDQIRRLLEQQFPPTQTGGPRFLQISGLKYTYNASLPEGQRITSLTRADGTPIESGQTYTAAANSFLVPGGGDRFTVFKEAQNTTTVGGDLDALEAYIDSLTQPFTAPDPATEKRITKQG